MEIISEEMFNEVIKERCLIDFYATWCGPCKMMSPIIENIKEIKSYKLDVDKFPNITKKYGVMSIPTLIIFENNVEVNRKIGYTPEEILKSWVK